MSSLPPLLLYSGPPPVSAFSIPWDNASTIILDKATSTPYYWNPDTQAVTAFAGGGGGGGGLSQSEVLARVSLRV
jgi:peptidoglycan hydrolase-like amidase